jgi:hypothetical protein
VLIAASAVHVVFLVVVAVLLYVVPAFLVARLAERKGRSYGVYLVASLVIGWLFVLIVVLVIRDRSRRI